METIWINAIYCDMDVSVEGTQHQGILPGDKLCSGVKGHTLLHY